MIAIIGVTVLQNNLQLLCRLVVGMDMEANKPYEFFCNQLLFERRYYYSFQVRVFTAKKMCHCIYCLGSVGDKESK